MYRYTQTDLAFLHTTMLACRAGTIICATVTSFLFLALVVVVCCIALPTSRGRCLRTDLLHQLIAFKFWINARYTRWKEDRRARRERREEGRINLRALPAAGVQDDAQDGV